MNNYSTLPYGSGSSSNPNGPNNTQMDSNPNPNNPNLQNPNPTQNNSKIRSACNSPYGAVAMGNMGTPSSHRRCGSLNSYEGPHSPYENHDGSHLENGIGEDGEPEWVYPSMSNTRQFVLHNNLQNITNSNANCNDVNLEGNHHHAYTNLTLGHSPHNLGRNSPYFQQQHQQHHQQQPHPHSQHQGNLLSYTNSLSNSPVPNLIGRQSPYTFNYASTNGTLNNSRINSPIPMATHPQSQNQTQTTTLSHNNFHNKAAVVKQLQEKFGGSGTLSIANSDLINNINNPSNIPPDVQGQHLSGGGIGSGANKDIFDSPQSQHQSQPQQLHQRRLTSNGNNTSGSGNGNGHGHGIRVSINSTSHPSGQTDFNYDNNSGSNVNPNTNTNSNANTNCSRFDPLQSDLPINNKGELLQTSPRPHQQFVQNSHSNQGMNVGMGMGVNGGGGSCTGRGVTENMDNGDRDGSRGTYLKSAWVHCRLPLLLVLIAVLLIIFLSFSGILIYFKYVPYKIRGTSLEDEPCEESSCAFGASCFVENGRGHCRCPESCAQSYSPVCGTDDLTYSNECLLRLFACQNQKTIRIRHAGECDMPNPCADKACLFGSRCVPSADGHYATCECPTSCPNYGDSEDSQSVCGSDGVYYRNRCELDRQACKLGRNITVKFYGNCDPCDDVSCPAPQVCHLDEERRPTCRCGETCSMDFNPVCSSDGKTYSNDCVMRQEACRSRRDLRIVYRGKCSSGPNPCSSRTCRGYESCAVDKFGIAQCVCAMKCDPVVSLVCGTDNRTYDSHCDLTLIACREGRQVTVAYRGPCESGNACAKHSCPPGATCSENKNGGATCECPVCPADYDPVCGSDGVSYQNECRLRMESCLTNNNNIRSLYPGLCNLIRDFNPYDGCDRKQCDFYSICVSQGSEAKCVCPTNCTTEVALSKTPVCGTDSVTYSTECELRKAACQQQKFIVVASKGHCDLCANVHCKFGAQCENGTCVCPTECPEKKEPVCASNLITYANECELQKTACRLGRPLTVHFYGDCTEGLNPASININSGGNLNGVPGSAPGSSSSSNVKPSSHLFPIGGKGPDPSVGTGIGIGSASSGSSSGSAQTTAVDSSGEGPKMCESIRCDFGAVCELGEDGFPRCTCQFNCTAVSGNQICASDLKLYVNECEMRREACHRQTELRPRPMELCEETEIRPCNGDEPLKIPGTENSPEDINCGNGPNRQNCPSGSYCHRTSSFAKCCKKPEERTTTKRPAPRPQPRCDDSIHGCCPDGVTSAMGEEHAGCPSTCGCNKLGSIAETCDPFTQECQCRTGVGTPKCDRCLPGFWGLSRIAVDGHLGCRECGCSKFGSVRDDCEQMTGRCVCKPGVLGHKCDSCAEGEFLGPYGCTSDPINLGRTCHDIVCRYQAECEQDGNRAGCVCNMQCPDQVDPSEEVCASDGFTYESDCMVRLQSCRSQKGINVLHKGPCESGESDGTESPIRRWTGLYFTEPGDDGSSDDVMGLSGESSRSNGEIWKDQGGVGGNGGFSSGMKSTRHLPPESYPPNNGNENENDDENYNKNQHETNLEFPHNNNGYRSPTSVTIKMKSFLGDACQTSSDCITPHSVCLSGWCICKEGYYEDDTDRLQCKKIHSHLSGILSCDGKDSLSLSLSSGLCQEPASCVDHRNGSYSCMCPLGTAGPSQSQPCSIKEPPYPFFTGRSTITLGKLAGYHKLSIELEITPYLNYAHGSLIFSSQHGNGSGDFLSLSLIDGFVEFRYDLGDGAALLRSTSRVLSGSTYHIVAKRYNRDGLLRVSGDEEVKGTSPGSMKSLNLDHGSYMGFIPLNTTKIWEVVGTSEGFVGCIHKLKVGRRTIDFGRKTDSLLSSVREVYQCPVNNLLQHMHRLTTTPMYSAFDLDDLDISEHFGFSHSHGHDRDHDNSPSSNLSPRSKNENESETMDADRDANTMERPNVCWTRNPCHNHGLCWQDSGNSNGYRCVCHPEFTGKHCESRTSNLGENGIMLDFRGSSALELPKIENGGRHVTIELWLMIRSNNSLILYNGQDVNKGDFITLLLSHGHLQFLFDLGSGIANLTWHTPITLNKWHWIVASREGRDGKLQVDGHPFITAKSPPSLSELNLELPLYFGGVGESSILNREFVSIKPLDGALQYIKINGETYNKEIGAALKERKVHRYQGPPCGSSVSPPCSNGGTCLPRLSNFVCLCPAQFSGKTCEGRKEVPGPIRFDGQNYLQLPKKLPKSSGKHESLNLTDYDDFYNEHFDSQLDELFGDAESSNDGGADTDANKEDGDDTFPDVDVIESDDFIAFVEEDGEDIREGDEQGSKSSSLSSPRPRAQIRNRLEIVFRTTSKASGLILWTGQTHIPNSHSVEENNDKPTTNIPKRSYLGLFIVDGYPELRIDLDVVKNKKPVIIRSKIKVNDNRWHQVLIARRRRQIVMQIDGSTPRRATAPSASGVLVTDGRYWIGGIASSILPSEIPASYHQGFIGCVDLVRIEKRRLPLSKLAYSTGIPFCDDST